MTLGKFVSDLSTGDVFESVVYEMTPFVVREYCHGVEETWEGFHAPSPESNDIQVAAPTLAHIEKIRLLKKNCPGGAGPTARIHFEYHAKHHEAIPAGTMIETSGKVTERIVKRGREYLHIEIEVRSQLTGQLFTSYRDTAILSFERKSEQRGLS